MVPMKVKAIDIKNVDDKNWGWLSYFLGDRIRFLKVLNNLKQWKESE